VPGSKILVRVIVTLVLCLGLFLFAVARYGVVETRYRCEGDLIKQDDKFHQTIYLKIQLYRPFIFWSDHDGMVWTEIPNEYTDLYLNVEKYGDAISFYTGDKEQTGQISTLS
jgi:hypothetical protein